MPNIKSAKKRVSVTHKKNEINTMRRSALKTAIKKANTAIESNDENSTQVVNNAVKLIDRSAVKGIIHKKTAARKKSNLQRKLNAASAE